MGIAKSILGIRVIFALIIIAAAVGLSTWGLVSTGKRIESAVEHLVDKYDAYLPEITIKNGLASIKEKQPYFVDTGDKSIVVVIDTREPKQSDAMDYLKDANAGAVLNKDRITVKSEGKIQVFPIKELPDMTLNAQTLRELAQEYFPLLMRVAAIVVVFYFLFAKLFQILMLALIPYVAARSYNADLSFGGALKLATVAMIPPVALEALLGFTGIRIPGWFFLYFVIYIALLIYLVKDFIRSSPPEISATESIHP
jgi:hypothetical protein